MHPLRQAREAHGLSQDELTRRAGISYGTVRRIEKGKSYTIETADKLAQALNLPLAEVWGWQVSDP